MRQDKGKGKRKGIPAKPKARASQTANRHEK